MICNNYYIINKNNLKFIEPSKAYPAQKETQVKKVLLAQKAQKASLVSKENKVTRAFKETKANQVLLALKVLKGLLAQKEIRAREATKAKSARKEILERLE